MLRLAFAALCFALPLPRRSVPYVVLPCLSCTLTRIAMPQPGSAPYCHAVAELRCTIHCYAFALLHPGSLCHAMPSRCNTPRRHAVALFGCAMPRCTQPTPCGARYHEILLSSSLPLPEQRSTRLYCASGPPCEALLCLCAALRGHAVEVFCRVLLCLCPATPRFPRPLLGASVRYSTVPMRWPTVPLPRFTLSCPYPGVVFCAMPSAMPGFNLICHATPLLRDRNSSPPGQCADLLSATLPEQRSTRPYAAITLFPILR